MKRLAALALALLMLCGAALAEDVFVIEDVEEATLQSFSSALVVSASYLRIDTPELSGDAMVIITDMEGGLVYQQDYGYSEAFCSDDIYLPLVGDSTDYNVDLEIGGMLYSFLVERVPSELDDSWNFWDDSWTEPANEPADEAGAAWDEPWTDPADEPEWIEPWTEPAEEAADEPEPAWEDAPEPAEEPGIGSVVAPWDDDDDWGQWAAGEEGD